MSAMMSKLLTSSEFCKLRYDTIPVKSASANVSFYTNNSKMPNFELWHSCRKWVIIPPKNCKNVCQGNIYIYIYIYIEIAYALCIHKNMIQNVFNMNLMEQPALFVNCGSETVFIQPTEW